MKTSCAWSRWMVTTTCALLLTACGTARSARMWFPKFTGMDEVNPQLYVEPAMSTEQRQDVQQQIVLGRAQAERFYGSITTTPYFVACMTDECDKRFGSYGTRAAAFGDVAIRLSANGLSAPLVALEWSLVVLFHRVGGWWNARKIPRWFDEGVAVVVADEPRHSEENWHEIQHKGLPVPQLSELVSFRHWGSPSIDTARPWAMVRATSTCSTPPPATKCEAYWRARDRPQSRPCSRALVAARLSMRPTSRPAAVSKAARGADRHE